MPLRIDSAPPPGSRLYHIVIHRTKWNNTGLRCELASRAAGQLELQRASIIKWMGQWSNGVYSDIMTPFVNVQHCSISLALFCWFSARIISAEHLTCIKSGVALFSTVYTLPIIYALTKTVFYYSEMFCCLCVFRFRTIKMANDPSVLAILSSPQVAQ